MTRAQLQTAVTFVATCIAGGCSAHHPQLAPPPAVRTEDPSRPGVVRVDSVTSREVLTHDDLAKIRAAGTNVDTIIATPDTVVIHVGSTTPPADLVQVRALDAAGQPIAHFVQSIIYPRSDQYDFRGGNFLAVAPGQTIFYIEALPRYPSEPRTRPSTAVVLKVVP